MRMILRQVMISILLSTFVVIILGAATYLAFPRIDWTLVLEQQVFDFPYWAILLLIPACIGIIGGLSYGLFLKGLLRRVETQLSALVKGQKRTLEGETPEAELDGIQQLMDELEAKMKEQTLLSQKLATERATEREKSLQEVVAQERNRLARDLHDSVSQQLFAASMMMSAINDVHPPEDPSTAKQMRMVEHMIHQSQLEMRALLLHLRPVALKGKTLHEGVEELLHELTQKVPMEIDWKVEKLELEKGMEDQLFRILQESVSNTLRHAKADHLHVMLIERDEMIILRVIDDGIGFDVQEAKTSSYGLQNMKERAVEIGGALKVVSLKNQGTRLEVKVPHIIREVENGD
ncbi:sensor histidine kinase [Thalassobacillus hwangdonensis]|uniref:Sensor histidine kinase n=1 Tax=Thalassobacillus hwangdonensis TaxID=546108 RepID=A0ABW3L434_9BACI